VKARTKRGFLDYMKKLIDKVFFNILRVKAGGGWKWKGVDQQKSFQKRRDLSSTSLERSAGFHSGCSSIRI